MNEIETVLMKYLQTTPEQYYYFIWKNDLEKLIKELKEARNE